MVESPIVIPATPCLLRSQLASKPPQGPVKLHLNGQFTSWFFICSSVLVITSEMSPREGDIVSQYRYRAYSIFLSLIRLACISE